MQDGAVVSISPSFNSYSNTNLAEIAARVVEEFRAEDDSEQFYDEFYFERKISSGNQQKKSEEGLLNSVENDAEFEFAFVTTKDYGSSSPISADEIFQNGKIRPIYPVFNGYVKSKIENKIENKNKTIRLPLRELFIEERESSVTTSSSSSSDADELDGVPAEMYCVWLPKSAAREEVGRCTKSSSAGSISKRWKLKGLLRRSPSEGSKDDFVLLSPSHSLKKGEGGEKIKQTPAGGDKVKPAAPPLPPSMYRRTYLPYRQDLVGFFSNGNAFTKNQQFFQ